MLLYKVTLSRKDKTEIVFQTISSVVKLPTEEVYDEYIDTILTINTCDSSMLTPEDAKLYQSQNMKQR